MNGEIDEVYGKVLTSLWNIDVEDNAFFQLKSNNIIVQCHVSWTNWKNIFSYEIYFQNGYIIIEGLGGSYGTETLEIGIRNMDGGKPDIKKYQYKKDDSWKLEWENFKNAIEQNTPLYGTGVDGFKANQIIDSIYSSSKLNKPVSVK